MLSKNWLLLLTTAAAPVLWGTTYLVTAELLPPERPLLSGLLRALPAGLLLLLVVRRLPAGHWWWKSAILGARVIQGLGGALMLPVGRLVVLRAYPRSELVRIRLGNMCVWARSKGKSRRSAQSRRPC